MHRIQGATTRAQQIVVGLPHAGPASAADVNVADPAVVGIT